MSDMSKEDVIEILRSMYHGVTYKEGDGSARNKMLRNKVLDEAIRKVIRFKNGSTITFKERPGTKIKSMGFDNLVQTKWSK